MTYKAALFFGAERVEIEELPDPVVSEPEVLIYVQAANICPTDVRKYKGLDKRYTRLPEPIVLGHEVAGTVIETGEAVQNVQKGDEVAVVPGRWCKKCRFCIRGEPELCDKRIGIGASVGGPARALNLFRKGIGGAFAEKLKVHSEQVIRIPPNVSVKSASLAEPFADVIKAQDNLGVDLGDRVVIFGLGPMGLLHVLYSNLRGAESIIGVDPVEDRRKLAEEWGCVRTIDPFAEDPTEVVKRITENGADVIVVSVGGSAQAKCTEQGIRVAGKGARLCIFAGTYPATSIAVDPNIIHYRQLMVTGSFAYNTSHFVKALNLMRYRRLDLSNIRTPELQLERIKEGLEIYGSPPNLKVGINP